MKSATISILAAALATVCSAAPTPSAAAVAGALPESFTLDFVSLEGTSLDKFPSTIFANPSTGGFAWITLPGSLGTNVPIPLTASGPSSAIVHGDPEFNRNWFFGIQSGGVVVLTPTFITGGYTKDGFGQVDGAFTFDIGDGKGPQSLWAACLDPVSLWYKVFWDPASTDESCVKIALNVVTL